jgi:hypothetical protein
VLAPYTALVPLLELGPGKDSPCGELLANLQRPASRNPAAVKAVPGANGNASAGTAPRNTPAGRSTAPTFGADREAP